MAYLDTVKPHAISAWHSHQILASILGVQSAHESGWGTSALSKAPYWNQFGIKASPDWTGRTVNMRTQEHIGGTTIWVYADFRAYDSMTESIADYAEFFTSTEWRKENYKLFVGEPDYKKACWALQNAGYATDPYYATKLINNIETYGLQKWDQEAISNGPGTSTGSGEDTPIADKLVGGDLTSAARSGVKDLQVTWIGDSLGVGTKPFAEELVPNSNFDVLGSRQISHTNPSLNALKVVMDMEAAGTLREYVVFIIGTNRGVTKQEVDDVVAAVGLSRKIILVDTASEVTHSAGVQGEYYGASDRHENAFYANWNQYARSMRASWYTPDGAGGKYIHMTPEGYRKHAEFLTQALYEVSTGDFTERTAETPEVTYSGIEDFELSVDGIVKYFEKTKQVWHDDRSYTLEDEEKTHDIGIKGFYSPMGSNNIYYPEANQRWGYGPDHNHDLWQESVYENPDISNGVMLIEGGVKYLLEKSQPDVTYKVNLRDMDPNISVGDTGVFIDHDHNPPLYIQGRVSSITTSKTDVTLSRVEITNVIELSLNDNDVLKKMRDEIAKSRQMIMNEMRANEVLSVRVTSSNGSVLTSSLSETQLTGAVYRGGSDVSYQYGVYRWERVSGDAVADAEFNGYLSETSTATLNVYRSDIIGKDSTFICRVYSTDGRLVGNAKIVLRTSAEVDIESELERKLELGDLNNAFESGISIGGRILTGQMIDQLMSLLEPGGD